MTLTSLYLNVPAFEIEYRLDTLPPYQQALMSAADVICKAKVSALLTWALTTIHPLAGAIVAITASASHKAVDLICKKINCSPVDTTVKMVANWFIYVGSIVLGTLAANAAGFAIGFKAAIMLNLLSTIIVFGGNLCLVAAVIIVKIVVKLIELSNQPNQQQRLISF